MSFASAVAAGVTILTAPAPALTGLSVAPPQPSERGYAIITPTRPLALHRSPGGPRLGAATTQTNALRQPGSFWVIRRRGAWVAISAPVRADNRLVWVKRADVRTRYTRKLVEIDLSARRLTLWHGRTRLFRAPVAVGRASAPTPVGLTSVQYHMASGLPAYYGPRLMALGMRQPAASPGFPQGGIMAIHGTDAPGAIGRASSAGCVRLANARVAALARRVPRGTPVVIHR